jgi:hypothetical protein
MAEAIPLRNPKAYAMAKAIASGTTLHSETALSQKKTTWYSLILFFFRRGAAEAAPLNG